jgi:hypothetical protein
VIRYLFEGGFGGLEGEFGAVRGHAPAGFVVFAFPNELNHRTHFKRWGIKEGLDS